MIGFGRLIAMVIGLRIGNALFEAFFPIGGYSAPGAATYTVFWLASGISGFAIAAYLYDRALRALGITPQTDPAQPGTEEVHEVHPTPTESSSPVPLPAVAEVPEVPEVAAPIACVCPNCNALLKIPIEYAGQTGTCTKCGAHITVPRK